MQFKLSGAQRPLFFSARPIGLGFSVCARVRGSWTPDELQGALERLRRRHPLLAVRVEAEPNGPGLYFTTEDVPSIALRVAQRETEDAWTREVEREIVQPCDYHTGPPFRCVWLRGADVSDLILVCDHATADGRACIYALRDLLRLLADPRLILEPLPPTPLAELIPAPMRSRIARVIAAHSKAAPRDKPFTESVPAADPLRVIPFALDRAQTSALVSRCRAEEASVQAALCAAFAMTFAEREPTAPVRSIESPIDIRARLRQPVGEVYGNYISLLLTQLNCAPGRKLWDIAREAHQDLAASPDERIFTIPIVMLSLAEQPMPMAAVDICYDVSISNLGRVDIPAQYGPLQLEGIYGPTFNASQPGHRVLGVTTFNGQMRCTFASCDPAAPQLVRRAREFLGAMCASPN